MNAKVERALRHGLTVADLISELEGLPPDAKVVFACDYGDCCHTQQALPVSEAIEVESTYLVESGYSRSGIALIDDDPDEDEENEAAETKGEPIIVLK